MSRRIAITGASGFIGRHLCAHFTAQGDAVLRLVRRPADAPDEVSWIPSTHFTERHRLEGIDAVIHLAGAGIADQRWTRARRRVLRDSRCATTTHLIDGLRQLDTPPEVLLQASAVGVYGDRGNAVLTDTALPGSGFLPELAQAWEHSGECYEGVSRRCVLRLGAVLGPDGGMLHRVLGLFRCGLGGRLGNGKQWFPWISITDVCRVCSWLIDRPWMRGTYNICAPTPVPNALFTQALGIALSRPTFAAVPAPLLRLALGAMADELLLTGQRAIPERLLQGGYQFKYPAIDAALADLLSK